MPFTAVWIKTAVDPTHCNRRSSARRDTAGGRTFQQSAAMSVAFAVRIAVAATNAGNAAVKEDEDSPAMPDH